MPVPKNKNGLTKKQQKFCEEYLVDLNATQAAIRAGYSPKTSEVIGYENLKKPQIEQYIQALREKQSKKLDISKEDNLKTLKKIKDVLVSDIMNFDGKKLTFKSLDEIPQELMIAIKSINQRITESGRVEVNVTLYDRYKAIAELNKMMGYYEPEKKDVNINVNEDLSKLSEEELDLLEKIKQK